MQLFVIVSIELQIETDAAFLIAVLLSSEYITFTCLTRAEV